MPGRPSGRCRKAPALAQCSAARCSARAAPVLRGFRNAVGGLRQPGIVANHRACRCGSACRRPPWRRCSACRSGHCWRSGGFPARRPLIVLVNALLGLPPAVVGLALYLLLSRSGPLGFFGLLFTPEAMILAQAVLALPIVTALSHRAAEGLWREYRRAADGSRRDKVALRSRRCSRWAGSAC